MIKGIVHLLRVENFIIFLCFSLSMQSQTKQSIIRLDRMNLVYRGMTNPISVMVNNAKSYKVYGNGIEQKEDGSYFMRPGMGKEAKIYVEITQLNNTIITEEHVVRIKNIPNPIGSLNEEFSTKGFLELTKEELKNAIVGIKLIDFIFDIELKVSSFTVKYGKEEMNVEGNKIDENAFKLIKKLNKGSEFIIEDIRYYATETRKVTPIKIRII